MKLSIIGSRGFLVEYGGYETFVKRLVLELKNKYEIMVLNDKREITKKINKLIEKKGYELCGELYLNKNNILKAVEYLFNNPDIQILTFKINKFYLVKKEDKKEKKKNESVIVNDSKK